MSITIGDALRQVADDGSFADRVKVTFKEIVSDFFDLIVSHLKSYYITELL